MLALSTPKPQEDTSVIRIETKENWLGSSLPSALFL